MNEIIYLDHAATTPICSAAKKTIIKHLDDFGNPSSSYELGRKPRVLIEDARERIAKCINAEPDEIYFTSGGSEANTWALNQQFVLATTIEHHSIYPMDRFMVDRSGVVNLKYVRNFVQDYVKRYDLDVLSCMMVNNEIGIVQPIKGLANVARKNNILFHTDAVQAVGNISVDVKYLNCDMLSASGHKFGAPKGIGFLYIKDGVDIDPLIHGGKQESGLRGGTENILGIVAMAAALEDAVEHMEERNKRVSMLRNNLLDKLLQISGSHLNGSLKNRVSGNINIRFDGVSGSKLVTLCNLYGVCISSGSACNEGASEPSHVLKAIGLTDEEALSSVRITIGHENTEEEVEYAADIITKLVERIRNDET